VRSQSQDAGRSAPTARQPTDHVAEVIDFRGHAAAPMSCVDCCAMFGDGFAAAEHARRHSHLVAIDYRPTERWRAELRAKNLSIAAAAQALASSDRGIPR